MAIITPSGGIAADPYNLDAMGSKVLSGESACSSATSQLGTASAAAAGINRPGVSSEVEAAVSDFQKAVSALATAVSSSGHALQTASQSYHRTDSSNASGLTSSATGTGR